MYTHWNSREALMDSCKLQAPNKMIIYFTCDRWCILHVKTVSNDLNELLGMGLAVSAVWRAVCWQCQNVLMAQAVNTAERLNIHSKSELLFVLRNRICLFTLWVICVCPFFGIYPPSHSPQTTTAPVITVSSNCHHGNIVAVSTLLSAPTQWSQVGRKQVFAVNVLLVCWILVALVWHVKSYSTHSLWHYSLASSILCWRGNHMQASTSETVENVDK